jgi:hypothetical protein
LSPIHGEDTFAIRVGEKTIGPKAGSEPLYNQGTSDASQSAAVKAQDNRMLF